MGSISLYNLQDHTLIILDPKNLTIEVKATMRRSYTLDKEKFAILYLLILSRPNVVRFKHFNEVLDSIDLKFSSRKALQNSVSNLKRELKLMGVNKLIISFKAIGYTISNIWVEPSAADTKPLLSPKLKSLFTQLAGVTASQGRF